MEKYSFKSFLGNESGHKNGPLRGKEVDRYGFRIYIFFTLFCFSNIP